MHHIPIKNLNILESVFTFKFYSWSYTIEVLISCSWNVFASVRTKRQCLNEEFSYVKMYYLYLSNVHISEQLYIQNTFHVFLISQPSNSPTCILKRITVRPWRVLFLFIFTFDVLSTWQYPTASLCEVYRCVCSRCWLANYAWLCSLREAFTKR